MFVLKLIRKLYKGLSGADSPNQIAFGFGLGIVLGLTPTTSGMGLLLIAVILLFRVSLAFAFVGWALAGTIRAALLSGFLAQVGFWVLEVLPLHSLWKALLNLPLLALLGLERYEVMGGFAVGLSAALALWWPIRYLVQRYRDTVVERLSRSKIFKYVTNLWLVRILRWILVGAT